MGLETSLVCVGLVAMITLVALLAGSGVAAGMLALQKSRKCRRCGYGLAQMSESELAELLEPGQRAEVEVGAVRWEGWHCANCANVERDSELVADSPFALCPSCDYRTMPASGRQACVFCGSTP